MRSSINYNDYTSIRNKHRTKGTVFKRSLKKIEVNNLKIKLQSSVYETPAWGGVADQDFFKYMY